MAATFESFMMQCLKAEEGALRRWLEKKLPEHGFTVIQDDYVSERASKNSRYKDVHNMLAVRGNPNICLVAHTDVCRDHSNGSIYYGEASKAPKDALRVQPVIKKMDIKENDRTVTRRVIQDRECKLQVGGDDRCGVAINSWIALNTGLPMALLFTTDEEVGLKSADKVKFEELKEYDLCLQTDRGNRSNELVTKISTTVLCDYETTARLLEIAYDMNMPRRIVTGANTDVLKLKNNGFAKNAVNMTCGYHESHSNSPDEYIDIEEATNTMHYCAEIVKTYFLMNKKG